MWLVNFVKEKEGFRSEAYQDAVGVWTIGYGTTKGVKKGDKITEEMAEERLRDELHDFLSHVKYFANQNNYTWNENQVGALTSFIYNLGKGALNQVTAGGKRSNEEIAKKMRLYYNAGGKKLRGLEIRRNEEADHFLAQEVYMPKQIIPVTGLSDAGLIADMPPVTLPPNAFSDCNNVRFRNGAASKVRGAIDIMPFVMLGTYDILKYVAWWPSPNLAIFNQGYYLLVVHRDSNEHVYVLKVGELGTAEEPVVLEDTQPLHTTSHIGGNWQHTLFQGGFAFVINNGLEAPHYILDPADNTEVSGLGVEVSGAIVNRFGELPGWDSYAVDLENVGNVTAAVIRSFGDFLVAGNLVERTVDGGDIVRSLPGVIRTSDIAAAGSIPQNWNPFATGVNTADEFTLTADGVVQDLVELQGKMFAYSNSSISSISRTGNPAGPFSVATVTPAYGALTTDSVIEFDGRHFVVGAQDIYMFSGHPGSIQSIGDGRIRDYFYNDLNLVDLTQLFVLRYQQEDEIWICYPSQEAIQGRADKALIFNYRHNTWSKRDLPGVFNGVIGPVPGGGLPMASLGFEGEAQVSSVVPGVNHEVSIDGLVDLEMEGDGREYKETLDLSGIRLDAITDGDPSIRVTLLEDFYTGSDTPMRIVVRAVKPSGRY